MRILFSPMGRIFVRVVGVDVDRRAVAMPVDDGDKVHLEVASVPLTSSVIGLVPAGGLAEGEHQQQQ